MSAMMTTDVDNKINSFTFYGEEMIRFKDHYSFLSNSDWEFTDLNGREMTVVAMYFALTSLSTCGFGDLYP